MDRIAEAEALETILPREIQDYANVSGYKTSIYCLEDALHHIYSVVVVPHQDYPHADKTPVIILMAQLIEDKAVIYQDMTDKPLYKELLRCGVPRSQIILRYAGEPAPELSDEEDDEK